MLQQTAQTFGELAVSNSLKTSAEWERVAAENGAARAAGET